MTYTTQHSNENIVYNLSVGGDFSTSFSSNDFINFEDFKDFNNFLLNDDSINNLESCFIDSQSYTSVENYGSTTSFNCSLYTLDISNYLDIIQENGKPLPNPNFDKKLEKLVPKENRGQNEPIPIFLSRYFLRLIDKEIDDFITIQHFAYESNSSIQVSMLLELQIVGEIEMMPGLFSGQLTSNRDKVIFMDINNLDLEAGYFHGKSIISFIDLEVDSNEELAKIEYQLVEKISSHSPLRPYKTYNQNWNIIEGVELNLEIGSIGFYRLIFNMFIIVGIMIGIISAPVTKNLIEEDKYELRNMLNRGFKQKSFLKLFLLEGTILFLESLLIGTAVGFLFSFVQNKITFQVFQYTEISRLTVFLNFPISMQFKEIIGALILNIGFFIMIFLSIFSPSLKENEESSDSLLFKYKLILVLSLGFMFILNFLLEIPQGFQIGIQFLILWFFIEIFKSEFGKIVNFIFKILYKNRSKIFILITIYFFFNSLIFMFQPTGDKIMFSIIAIISYFAIQALIQDIILKFKKDKIK